MTPIPVTPVVTADLPGLPGVPASIGPLVCPECEDRTAAVHHLPDTEGWYSALLRCGDCGATFEMEATAYAAGLAAGVLAGRAKRVREPGSSTSTRKPYVYTAQPCDSADPAPGVRLLRQVEQLGRLSASEALALAADLVAAATVVLGGDS